MKNPEKLIGKKVRGFKFEQEDEITFDEQMEKYIGEVGVIEKIYTNDVKIVFKEDYFFYPLNQIEAHLVEEQNEIPTFTKEDLKSFYNIGFLNGVNNDNKSSCLEFEKEFKKRFSPTKEEQLTAILGSSEKVSEIMELFKDKK